MADPFFTLAIFTPTRGFLLSETLDTLRAQSDRDFEVFLLSDKKGTYFERVVEQYPEIQFQIIEAKAKNRPSMMNQALRQSRGKYIQFLDSGDRYLSQSGLSFLRNLIEENKYPELIYFGFLLRQTGLAPRANFSLLNLKRGSIPLAKSSWFFKEALLKVGGFDEKLAFGSSFDLYCRLLKDESSRVVFCKRILTDSEPIYSFAKERVISALEVSRVLYRYFGLYPALRWIFAQDHRKMIRSTLQFLKQSFAPENAS